MVTIHTIGTSITISIQVVVSIFLCFIHFLMLQLLLINMVTAHLCRMQCLCPRACIYIRLLDAHDHACNTNQLKQLMMSFDLLIHASMCIHAYQSSIEMQFDYSLSLITHFFMIFPICTREHAHFSQFVQAYERI